MDVEVRRIHLLCYLCTCEQCGNILIDATCSKCNSGAGNSFVYDPNPKSFNEVQSIFNRPTQPHYNIYLCQYVKAIPTIVMNVRNESRLSMSQNCATIKAMVIILIHMTLQVDDKSFSDENIPKEIYSNPLFDEEIICIKIDMHHFNVESDLIESLLNHDSSIISSSSKIDSLLDEFAGELILLKSIPPGIDEANYDPEEEICLIEKLLYDNSSPRPPEEFIFENSDATFKSFSPSPIPVEDSDSLRDEINVSFTLDDSMPSSIEDDDYDPKGDILILEKLLSNDSLSLPVNESFPFDISSSPRPFAKPPDDDEIEPNLGILTVKVVGDISEHYVPMPRLLPTQPTLASNLEKSPHLLSHQGFKTFQLSSESSMLIYGGNIPILDVPFLHFYPP
nr:hypothetical protein [Tanacetum cinerariifolium]